MMACLTASRGTRVTRFDSNIGCIVYAFRQWLGEREFNAMAQGRQDAKNRIPNPCVVASLRLRVSSDIAGFCTAETIEGIGKHGFVHTSGRYVGAHFSMDIEVGDGGDTCTTHPRIREEIAYRDTSGKGVNSFIAMIYERLILMRDLLAAKARSGAKCSLGFATR